MIVIYEIKNIKTNKSYKSLSEAGNELNVHETTIRYRLNSDKFKNYKYK